MEEYLTKPEFSDRYFNGWMAEKSWNKQLGIIMSKYPHPWTQLRRFSLRHLRDFGFGKRDAMQSVIHAELHDLVHELNISLKENNGIHTFDNYFTVSALNVVWSMLAGRRFEHSDPKLLRLTKILKELFESCNVANSFLFVFPEWRNWFPEWTGMSTQRRIFKEMNDFLQEFVDGRKKLGIYKTSPENLVDGFLREMETWDDSEFTEQQLVALMGDFFMAGSETSSNTLAWCIVYLIRNPEVQEKLQKEIDSVVPKGTFPDAEHESKLHYVKATLAETHRRASVLPLGGPRTATEDSYCKEFLIPKGTYIITNLHGIHHDKAYWKDPENFRPERFLDENGKFKSDPRLKPFGFGKRICLGEPVASLSLLQYLTVLVQNFTFYWVPNEPLPAINPVLGITNGPQAFRALIECR
ncbi:Methyl farnesoate epoxidase [Orchesella cincta]|uniref:Methyl farnesoate epoxidase n=1 Tax=Orchesella cincta TaxID=48709 RepID=A0A1D2MIZ9_ORCCI|nr:Methyl farnesoate epoxidase [Orchesella cincta]